MCEKSIVMRYECDISLVLFRVVSEEYIFPPIQFAKFVNIYFFVYKDGERGVVLGGGGNYR
jgi:hypothetical protein